MASTSQQIFKLGYEISPIILVGGVASLIPGGMLPIVAITQAANFSLGLLSGTDDDALDLDSYFAHWKPLPGTTLINNQIGAYPFANQNIAANAMIAQPLGISMMMNCPVQQPGGYTSKLSTLTILQATLVQHVNAGGTFTIVSPSQLYTGCLLTLVRDVSGGESKQVQHTWQFDFIQPLTTQNQAQQVYSALMSKIAGGLPTSVAPTWSGVSAVVGAQVAGGSGGSTLLPSMSNLIGGNTSTVGSSNVGSSSAYGFSI